ncbi:MAG: DUF4445 domain-containing protein [Clostridia bacterium]|nr:DUF4445 domain-containing protein [Clostridia bacterium]
MNFMYKVTVNGEVLTADDGMLLSDLLIKSDKNVEHPCGGNGTCRKCIVTVNGKEELSCRYIIKSDITVLSPDSEKIISETGAEETGKTTENLCYVLDIGTTTLALALVSLDDKKIIKVITRTNPQRKFGADVMTRIDYCRKNGACELQKTIISEINSMISEFDLQKSVKLYVSGNTTMLHLLFGIDCSSIGVAPYTPTFLESKSENGYGLGINGIDTAESLPSISAFVGADIVAGLSYIGIPKSGKYNLLVDLGTNAEICLFSEHSALCTAAAAGPCFEGANISCGMSATDGAIYSYSKNEIRTVGDSPARGVCGTGLVDIIAELVCGEVIDETGFMECGAFEITDEVSINQIDIRQYQLAKSAVYSAIVTLLQIEGISFDDVEKMYISGGFSAKINIENAVKTGLLPRELAHKCIAVNNSSLLGTVKYACEKNDLTVYTGNTSYIDLSQNPVFSELFIDSMMFETE